MTDTSRDTRQTTGWVGWIYFASLMMMIVGGLQAIAGLIGILQPEFYIATGTGVVIWDFNTWGWIHLGVGILLVITGIALLSGRMWARVLASIIVVLSAIDNIVFLPAYPIWSIIALIINGLILYALTVHGKELKHDY